MTSTANTENLDGAKKSKDEFEITVNGEATTVNDETVTFREVVAIAYPETPSEDTTYTVTFGNAKGRRKEGELVDGQSVTIKKKGTTFDVYPTGKS